MARFLSFALGALIAVSGPTSSAQKPQEIASAQVIPPAGEVAAALQRKYDTVKDFSASFAQTEERSVLRKRTTESGFVFVKKPGKMRWDYTTPEKKMFVSDGRTFFMYFPADRQVIKTPVATTDQATSAVLFLMGKGDITRDFAVRYGEGETDDVYVLRLDPKKRQAEYDWLQITADRKTFQIRVLTAGDAEGGRSTFTFTNFKENPGLPDKMFEFEIPRGTEVITSGKTP